MKILAVLSIVIFGGLGVVSVVALSMFGYFRLTERDSHGQKILFNEAEKALALMLAILLVVSVMQIVLATVVLWVL